MAKSGSGGGDYFDESGVNKKQRTRSKSNDIVDVNMIDTRDEDIALMIDLGWVKNKKEVEELTSEQSPSQEEASTDRKDTSKSNNTPKADGSHKKQGRRDSKRVQNAVAFDYSNVGDIGIGGNAMGDNPFFTGAALVGGALQQQGTGKQERKKSTGGTQKRGKRNTTSDTSRVREGSVRSTVYRR